jgi:hypothetical protein
METMTSILLLGLIIIPLMTFFPTALEMMMHLFSMSTAVTGMPL